MKIIIDTSVWSLALRRKKENLSDIESKIVEELSELINETRAIMIGQIRQELLSGISNINTFEQLKHNLSFFEDINISTEDYEIAAQFYNLCKQKGIQGSFIDYLICSVASNNDFAIFTTDKDFDNYSKIIELKLHKTRNA